jgi:hypothetical protein
VGIGRGPAQLVHAELSVVVGHWWSCGGGWA